MGEHQSQPQLFTYRVNLNQRVRSNHPLRQVAEHIDFAYVRDEVRELYGCRGNVSVDPEIILKLMFLLFFDDVASERELMRMLPERLDYLWFLGLELDDPIPDHSVLSKARRRWGPARFESFFVRTVTQACEAGLVSGQRIYVDSTLVDADASPDKTRRESPHFPGFARRLKELHAEQENKLGELEPLPEPPAGEEPDADRPSGTTTTELTVNTTDPDAPLHKRPALGKARPRYKNHRAVDPVAGIITATETTGADVDDGARLVPLIEQSRAHTGVAVQAACADSHYGTHENYRQLEQRGIQAQLAVRRYDGAAGAPRKDEHGQLMFRPADFVYERAHDRYVCPAGKHLHPQRWRADRQARPYRSRPADCQDCPLRSRCTKAKKPVREILRHDGQEYIDQARARLQAGAMKHDLGIRMSLCEGSFAQGAQAHGLKRARWRRRWRVRIQNLLIASVQNIQKIIRHGGGSKNTPQRQTSLPPQRPHPGRQPSQRRLDRSPAAPYVPPTIHRQRQSPRRCACRFGQQTLRVRRVVAS